MINRVILVGRLTRDPELRKTQSGASVVSYTIAVNRRVQTPGQPDADFINCVAWNKTADLMAQYLHKGSLIGVEDVFKHVLTTTSRDNVYMLRKLSPIACNSLNQKMPDLRIQDINKTVDMDTRLHSSQAILNL